MAGRLFWKSHPEPEVFSAFAEIPPPVGAIQDAATACASPNNGTLKSFCNDNVDVCASTGVNVSNINFELSKLYELSFLSFVYQRQ